MARFRRAATRIDLRPRSRTGAVIVVLVWLALIVGAFALYRRA
jgi:hypothetical protein